MTYIAIDPGNCTGWALFSDRGVVLECGILDMKGRTSVIDIPISETPNRLVIEMPEVYSPGTSPANPKDIVSVAYKAGKLEEWFISQCTARGGKVRQIITPWPKQWKGQLDKGVHHAREWKYLSDEERVLVKAEGLRIGKSKAHNMLDAVCLGKWAHRTEAFE